MKNNIVFRYIVTPLLRIRKVLFICIYNFFIKPRLIKDIKKRKSPIKVNFLVINLGMWKSNKLFKLLKNDERFDPCIVTSFIPGDSDNYKEYVQNSILEYFASLDYPVIPTYDPKTKQSVDISNIESDVVFFPQPYHDSPKSLPNNVLFGYIPYDYPIQDEKVFHNWLYQNICWRIFAVNKDYKNKEEKYSYSRGRNVKVVGYSNADYYFDNHEIAENVWKLNDSQLKKIIWAPHHSILSTDTMGQSLFLDLAETFLKLTEKYKNNCQFVFKPHPRLKDKLYQLESWGHKRTDEYFDAWKNGENTDFVEGEYIDLFLSSDALIHDCSSFIAEYLYTKKPVMFTTKDSHDYKLEGNDWIIFDSQYKGADIQAIEYFINNVVIAGNDPKKVERETVLNTVLGQNGEEMVCEKIYKELVSLL